jgi:hypothetical protein
VEEVNALAKWNPHLSDFVAAISIRHDAATKRAPTAAGEGLPRSTYVSRSQRKPSCGPLDKGRAEPCPRGDESVGRGATRTSHPLGNNWPPKTPVTTSCHGAAEAPSGGSAMSVTNGFVITRTVRAERAPARIRRRKPARVLRRPAPALTSEGRLHLSPRTSRALPGRFTLEIGRPAGTGHPVKGSSTGRRHESAVARSVVLHAPRCRASCE